MNSKLGRIVISALCAGIVFCFAAISTPAADAAKIFRDIADAQNKIPQDVLRNAAAVGVFKGVFNLAFIGGHRQGDGAITIRTPGGWSAPVFYKLRGGGVGQDRKSTRLNSSHLGI